MSQETAIVDATMNETKDSLVREFAERLDALTLAADIGPDDVPYIVEEIVNGMRRIRVVEPSR